MRTAYSYSDAAQREAHYGSLAGQAAVLPLDELPKWLREAITAAEDELGVDALELAALMLVKFRKSQVEATHSETHSSVFGRHSEAIHRARGNGIRRNGFVVSE